MYQQLATDLFNDLIKGVKEYPASLDEVMSLVTKFRLKVDLTDPGSEGYQAMFSTLTDAEIFEKERTISKS